MTIHEMYEKVNLVIPLEQRRFFNYYEDSVDELLIMYDGFVFPKDTEYTPPKTLDADNSVLPLYHNAIVDNILFLAVAGGENNQMYKTEFLRKSRAAYHKYWSDNAKGKRIKRLKW
ncbi:MAG: hypothetical protein ACI4EA_09405 [Candidatus Ornithomonoglobus sp.]